MVMRVTSGVWGPAAVLLAGAVGCVSHVQIDPAPRRDAPWPERARAFQRLRPVGLSYSWDLPMVSGGWVTHGRPPALRYDDLLLPGDVRVSAPTDLLAAVAPDSAYARAARSAGLLRTLADTLEYGGGVMMIGGVIALPVALDLHHGDALVRVSLGAIGLGLLAAIVGGVAFHGPSRRARAEAFIGYERSLRERLGVCYGAGDALVDCDSRRPLEAPGARRRTPLDEQPLPPVEWSPP